VSDFPGVSILPRDKMSAVPYAGSESGAQGDVGEEEPVLVSDCSSDPKEDLSEDGGPAVVSQEDRRSEGLSERIDQRNVQGAGTVRAILSRGSDVRRVPHVPSVDRTGRSDADAKQRAAICLKKSRSQQAHHMPGDPKMGPSVPIRDSLRGLRRRGLAQEA
jgi:hypothetical protein